MNEQRKSANTDRDAGGEVGCKWEFQRKKIRKREWERKKEGKMMVVDHDYMNHEGVEGGIKE